MKQQQDMANKGNDIRDNELRVIGKSSARNKRNRLVSAASLLLIAGTGVILFLLLHKTDTTKPESEDGLFEEISEAAVPEKKTALLGVQTELSFTEKIDTVINDVILSLYIPHNASPELTLGVPDRNDTAIILAAQAADIRKDNRKILGAFVLKGEPLAWGLSKKGFCAIIDSVVTVGVSENSPLFEEATEKGGYFFRQYPLVDNGSLVENEPKGKSIRKALCSRDGQIFVAVSESEESFHDFAQTLVDLGVENAICLVGSRYSFGWYIGYGGDKIIFSPDIHRSTYKNETYIIWRSRRS